MVTFTDKSIIVEMPSNNPFEDYVSLMWALFEVSSQVIRSAENYGNIDSFYPIEYFVKSLTTLDGKQCCKMDELMKQVFLNQKQS